jgi:hypothetical protein
LVRETYYIIFSWIIMIVLLIIFTPKDKIRHAYVIFTFKQIMTWILGLTVAELRLIEYPVRSFAYANKASFDFEFFAYPAFCVLFVLHYPEGKSTFKQLLYYFYYCTALTTIESIVEKYTNIIEYINWTWYISYITFFITFFLSHKFYRWYFKKVEIRP